MLTVINVCMFTFRIFTTVLQSLGDDFVSKRLVGTLTAEYILEVCCDVKAHYYCNGCCKEQLSM